MAYQDEKTMMMVATQQMKTSPYGPASISASTIQAFAVPPWMGATPEMGGPVERMNKFKLWIGTC